MARLAELPRKIADYTKEIGAVASAIGAVVALALVLGPRLGCSASCSGGTTIREHLGRPQPATWGDYLTEINQPPSGSLAAQGLVLEPNLVLTGFSGKHVPVRWTLLRVDGVQTSPGFRNQLAYNLNPDACRKEISQPIWIPRPPTPGRYAAQLLVYDSSGKVVLHTSDPSPTVAVP